MCVTTDTRLGKWRFWGWLKDVEKDPGQEASFSKPHPTAASGQSLPWAGS